MEDSWGGCSANHRSSWKFLDAIEIPAVRGPRGILGMETGANAPTGPRKGGSAVLDSSEQDSDSRLQAQEFK